ncbi:MAG: hypothetical protein BWY82_02004 [Verrucomicrobia bacterium ADurb.Bin474]|nr:MAG: hypothetical protein BWY82_02004 [Verrucomicrobia bacterium ADurb.Bin474]
MDLIGHQFLACSVLARDQNGGLRSGHLSNDLLKILHWSTVTNDAALTLTFRIEIPADLYQLTETLRLLENNLNLIRRERLDHIIKSTQAHTVHGGLDRTVSGHHHHHRFVRIISDPLQ